MKNYLIFMFQRLLGYERYLRLFARVKIRMLPFIPHRKTYFYFDKLIPEDGVIAIIGASIGITTIPLVKGERKLFAYEPILSNIAVLKRLKRRYKAHDLSIFHLALGNQTDHVEIIFPVINGAKKHGLSYIKEIDLEAQPNGELVTTKMDRADNREELKNQKIDAIKIVAENYEFEILSGSMDLIKRDKPIIYCELWNNPKRFAVLNLIRSMNYAVFVLIDGKLKRYEDHIESYNGKHFIFRPE